MTRLTINAEKPLFGTAPDLYGLFFEDISRAGEGGLYAEMLRNRSFEDSLMPEGCVSSDGGRTFVSPTGWIEEFNNGEGMNDWVVNNGIVPTAIPAWYADGADMTLDTSDTLNPKRKASMKVCFSENGSVRNTGFAGIPAEDGRSYHFYVFLKSSEPTMLRLSVEAEGKTYASASFDVQAGGWQRYDAFYTAAGTTGDGSLVIRSDRACTVTFGFMSLMPEDTYLGHGLRKDLVEKLRDMNPAFLRFPGGCIVEGFTKETAMYFKNTVGPVWERPSHWLLWHYRATNGLGFHEYLQLCEDLDLAPLYVCNCGMTCQGRGPYYFNDEEQQAMLDDIFAALEYALGGADSEWGALRKRMGHEAPFRLDYLEIGNENWGPEYEKRFKMIREAVLAKYPSIRIVANDRGRGEKLPTDIADDHYYSMPEFFAENLNLYDSYDRNEPDVFVGEFAVNQTYEGQLRAAVSEAMFMVGLERNQDKVRLASYAPLFQHVKYSSWYPNLLIFDNYRSYTIPSYYCFRMFGGARGDRVLESHEEVPTVFEPLTGFPALTGDDGIIFRNPKLDGETVSVSRNINGTAEEKDGLIVIREKTEADNAFRQPALALLGETPVKAYAFETEVRIEENKRVGLGILVYPKPLSYYDRNNPNPVDPWSFRFLEQLRWYIDGGKSYVVRGAAHAEKQIAGPKDVNVSVNAFNTLSYTVGDHSVKLYVNGVFVDEVLLPHYQGSCSVVTDTEDEIIIKLVNFDETKADDVEISLNIPVGSDYTAEVLTGSPTDENTLTDPTRVRDRHDALSGAGEHFVYNAKPLSVNVLRLKKLK